MPCMDGGPSRAQIERESRDKVAVYRLACERCRDIDKSGGVVPDWAIEWWEFHRKEDMKRQQMEVRQRKQNEEIAEARSKLTPHEREILGV